MKYMDACQAPLNPCSIETLPESIQLADGRSVWPLMLSCYQLNEDNQTRVGQLNLSLLPVPDLTASTAPLQFRPDDTYTVLGPEESSGILDGQWRRMGGQSYAFASAHSSGHVEVHSIDFTAATPTTSGTTNLENDSNPLFEVRCMGRSECRPALCLSLRWDHPAPHKHPLPTNHHTSRMVSTYSDGCITVHDVVFANNHQVQFVQVEEWKAHNMFKSNAEVWSACFVNKSIWSGGDEGKLKIWDLRATCRPTQILQPFEAGVTCISPHPLLEHVVAVGSYNETICLYDERYMSQQQPLCHTGHLGGGIWRIKWHPHTPNRMLVAAMHGGCRVVNFGVLSPSEEQSRDSSGGGPKAWVTKKFTEHESMAYGADWLTVPHPKQNGYFEGAASCSFYDRAVFLWDTLF